ncbi:MAG: SDR family oxidoreductase [Pseudoclavibacter sp.]|nr:SDR family oxidoreductase [Pseudoclavibacter sp.]
MVVTGVSRRAGIGFAIARRAAELGADVFCHHFAPHDAQQPWGADEIDAVLEGVRERVRPGGAFGQLHADLADPAQPARVLAAARRALGRVDGLVVNQAMSGSDGPLSSITAEELDRHWAVDGRASLLLAQAFAAGHEPGRHGSIVFLTSGQGQGPMPGELAYAAAKAAVAGVLATLEDELAPLGIRVNAVNPGPVDTGYFTPELHRALAPALPFGRAGQPQDAARLVCWLLSGQAGWVSGQTLHAEGGFARHRIGLCGELPE